jgi:transposase InsO family protein
VKFELIGQEKAHFPIAFMCRQLGVSRAGYYAWEKRPESARAREERALEVQVAEVHQQSRRTYGAPRVQRELRRRGVRVAKKRVARLMRSQHLVARARRRYVCTTDSRHAHAPAPNVLKRDFSPPAPDATWATDITYVPTAEGWLYLAVVMDLFSRRIAGWATSARIDRYLVLAALDMALAARRPPAGLVHHSDRGCQYACADYQAALASRGLVPSMSRKGNCWDNACVESFFSSLKTECVYRQRFSTHAAARLALFDYLEVFYNRSRLHSHLGYVSPAEYEAAALMQVPQAA